MIREFWQERKEEKRKRKELKKQNKKIPKTKEQRAYQIFGILFTLFIILGSIFYTCKGWGSVEDYSWESLIGITDDMKNLLSKNVDKNELLEGNELSVFDFSDLKDELIESGLNVIVDEKINLEILDDKTQTLSSSLTLRSNLVGILASNMIEQGQYAEDIDLLELKIYEDNSIIKMKTLMYVNLSTVIFSGTLPTVYLTTISDIEILNSKVLCLNTNIKINNFDEKDNTEILKVLKKNSLLGIENYTNELVTDQINKFKDGINSKVEIYGLNLKFINKN